MPLEKGMVYEFGEFRLDRISRQLLHREHSVPLTNKCFDLLVLLVQSRGEVLTKEHLIGTLWPDTFVEEGNLTQNISVVRKALAVDPSGERYIETVPRRGYRFSAEVLEASSGPPAKVGAHRSPWRLRASLAVIVLALTAVGVRSWISSRASIQSPPALDSIVVLPFVNLSSEKENEYFSDGLTEELINTLTTIDGLRVVARTTAFQFKGKAQDIRSIGRELGVAAVLSGSVRKEENRLRVTAQLNSATNGYHFWSETYDRELKDVFAIQEQIAQAIQERVRQKLGGTDIRLTRPRPNLEAYNLYLQGRYHQARLMGKSMDRAIAAFEQAIEKDPNYAAAYAALAFCYTELGYSGQLPPKEAFPKAVIPLQRALSLDDSLAEAHALQGIISLLFDWDWDRARREFDRAISLNAASSLAHHWYSHYLVAMGNLPESEAESKRALELDPLDVGITSHQAWNYDYARLYGKAMAAAEKSLEIDPNHVPSLAYLQWAFEGAGHFDRAIGLFEKFGGSADDARALRRAVGASGALGYWRVRLEFAKREHMSNPFRMAELYAHRNEVGPALEWLGRAFQERNSWLVYLNSDPAFDDIRADPRFTAIVNKVGLPRRAEK